MIILERAKESSTQNFANFTNKSFSENKVFSSLNSKLIPFLIHTNRTISNDLFVCVSLKIQILKNELPTFPFFDLAKLKLYYFGGEFSVPSNEGGEPLNLV